MQEIGKFPDALVQQLYQDKVNALSLAVAYETEQLTCVLCQLQSCESYTCPMFVAKYERLMRIHLDAFASLN